MTDDNQNEDEAAHARCMHIYNTVYALAQLCLSEDEVGAVMSAGCHAWAHFHGNFEPDTIDVAVNIQRRGARLPCNYDRGEVMTEAFYDKEIAPELLRLAKLCDENGMSFVALVEYDPGLCASTAVGQEDACLEFWFTAIAARCRANLDGLVINILKRCRQEGISTDASMVARQLEAKHNG